MALLLALGLALALFHSGCGGDRRAAVPSAVGPAVMVVSDTVLDFGTMRSEETLERSVWVRNAGGGSLHLVVQPPSCRCLTVRPMELSVDAGEQAVLRVALNGRGLMGRELKWIDLTSNGMVQQARLYVFANVQGDVQFELVTD